MLCPLLAALLLPGLGCADGSACTEIGCEHEATVTFPAGLVTGAYTLVLEGERDTATARCLDPGNPETADNPVGLSCDGNGFVLEGLELANERELVVTVMPDDGDPFSTTVRLEAVDELTPNGPDCPPVCFVRNGQVRLGGP